MDMPNKQIIHQVLIRLKLVFASSLLASLATKIWTFIMRVASKSSEIISNESLCMQTFKAIHNCQ